MVAKLALVTALTMSACTQPSMTCTTPDCPSSSTDNTKVVIISVVAVIGLIALARITYDAVQLGRAVSAMNHGSNT
jgi:hypothetical protein